MFLTRALGMKLLTHNMLTSHVKGVKNGYPLKIHAKDVKENTVECNTEFIARMIPKIDFAVLKAAAQTLGYDAGLPDSVPENYESDEDFLKKMHHVMLEIELIEGELECPESGRKFPVSEGIPNMLLTEDGL